MEERPLDERDVAMFRLGFQSALQMCERLARQDRRVEIAKSCGYVPSWQKGRWQLADEFASSLRKCMEEAAATRS